MDRVTFGGGHRRTRLTTVRLILTQMLLSRLRVRTVKRHRRQRRFQQLPIGRISPTDHQAQRQAL